MKAAFLFALLLAGCATGQGGSSFFDAEVVGGNDRYVVVYDPFGVPGKSQQKAEAHCASNGRKAQFQAQGGNSYQCTSVNYCVTYSCVE